eukprot:9052310-Alexandrium_andersonii.AAC.1
MAGRLKRPNMQNWLRGIGARAARPRKTTSTLAPRSSRWGARSSQLCAPSPMATTGVLNRGFRG